MAIKMRHSDGNTACCSCGVKPCDALGMYDVKVGDVLFTICDVCNQELLDKTLKAETSKNGRIKSGHDMAIIRRRHGGTYIQGGGADGQRNARYTIQYDA